MFDGYIIKYSSWATGEHLLLVFILILYYLILNEDDLELVILFRKNRQYNKCEI